jgi:hypothetical protein
MFDIATPNWRALMPLPEQEAAKSEALPKVNNMTPTEQELCLKAERLIAEGDLDAATAAVRQFERVVKARHKVTVEHDDGDTEDDWSEPADAAGPNNNADGDDEDDSDDSEEDDDIPMKTRKSHQGNYTLTEGRHSNMQSSRPSAHAPSYSAVGQTAAVQRPARHKFDSRVDYIQQRDGCNKTTAMQRARQEFPETYTDYQGWHSKQTAQQQQMSRSRVDSTSKRAPVYREDLIAAEMAKGCNAVVAEQRVMQMWGNAAPPSMITKGADDLVDQFQDRVLDVVEETGCSLVEATQYVRKARPNLFKALRGE